MVTYAYNAQGQKIWAKDQAGNITETDYDTGGASRTSGCRPWPATPSVAAILIERLRHSRKGILSQTGNWARDKEDLNGDGDFTDTGEVDDTRTRLRFQPPTTELGPVHC